MRYEPAFFAKYVAALYTNNKVGATEAYARGISWGLMQVMGQTAREKGASSLYLSTLCDPAVGLAVGCRILRQKFNAAGGEAAGGVLAGDGGGGAGFLGGGVGPGGGDWWGGGGGERPRLKHRPTSPSRTM